MRTILFFSLLAAQAAAQSVIISVPSVDITPRGEVMVAHESQVNRFSGGRNYWNSFTFGTVGLGGGAEFAATLYGVGRPASGNVALGAGLKQRLLHKATTSGWHIESTAGFMVPFSLSGRGTGVWGYGNIALRHPRTRTRLTAGPSYGTTQIFGRRTAAAIVGVEQPVHPKLTLVADWFTGTHELGAAIAGLAWQPTRQLIVIAAYKVPNNAISGKPAPLVEVTYTFSLRGR